MNKLSALGFFRMKHLALIFSIPQLLVTAANAAPVIFIVRHAEKASSGGNDPDLSLQGQKRADALAHILKDSEIRSVFVTEFKRTQETAAPTARAAHVSPTVIPANDIRPLVEKLRALNGNALVVGHGNTIPDLLKALGVATPVSIPDDDYTEIFAVMVGDARQLLRLHYPF
jgi:broad specificity phosphatase PhoE